MNNLPLKDKKNKIDQIEKTLSEIWDLLTPTLKNRQILFETFLNIQTRARIVNLKIEKELKNETNK